MSEKNPATCTILHLRFRLRVSPHLLLDQSREAANKIASLQGLVWKIWLVDHDRSEVGGIYLFNNREAAMAYLNHPIIQTLCTNPAVLASDSQLWDVESSLSALTRAPLADSQSFEPEALLAGGR